MTLDTLETAIAHDTMTLDDLRRRPRRNRRTGAIRNLVRETTLTMHDLILPLFILDGEAPDEAIPSMPEVFRRNIDSTLHQLDGLCRQGLQGVDLFPYVGAEKKDPNGSYGLDPNNLLCKAIHAIKSRFPELCVMVDIALDPYTSHGHDGVLDDQGNVANDATLGILSSMSLLAAQCGADVIAPSDMMDGRVLSIRRHLDKHDLTHVSILSYTAKYASAFYGPFRDALHSAPKQGDKQAYQMSFANRREALLEAELDTLEGADALMVKPALSYLDVIKAIKDATHLPVAAYQVSGEYAMIMAAAQNGWLDRDRIIMETLTSIKRAGADIILSYAVPRVAELLGGR